MELKKAQEGNRLTVYIKGSLDALTAPELEALLRDSFDDADELILDLSGLEYSSSAGLRIFLMAQKTMEEKNGRLTLRGVTDFVMGILEETGLVSIINIED